MYRYIYIAPSAPYQIRGFCSSNPADNRYDRGADPAADFEIPNFSPKLKMCEEPIARRAVSNSIPLSGQEDKIIKLLGGNQFRKKSYGKI